MKLDICEIKKMLKTMCDSPIYYPKENAPGALLHRGRSEEDEMET